MSPINTVKVPPQFEEIFKKSAAVVAEYFKNKSEDPTKGTITIADERYILVRAASMSVEFFKIIADLFKSKGEIVAHNIAASMLFDIAHSVGKTDAENFAKKMNLKDPIERLSAGPVHFAYTGWAFVDILPESKPSPDENYFLIYDHPFSFESDSWIKAGAKTADPICIMNSGYSSGWCEVSFGIPLVAIEIECKAAGDPHDRFIMAQPSKIKEHIEQYIKGGGTVARKDMKYEIPGFFQEKFRAEELKIKNEELDVANQQLRASEQQLKAANQQLISAQAQLQDKVKEMEKFHALTVGREEKILEFKGRIKELEEQIKTSANGK